MRAYQADTLTELNEQMINSLIYGQADSLDMITSVDVAIHDVIGFAHSMEWDFDLKSYWLTPSRWTMMCRQYLDPEELQVWIDRCTSKIGTKGRGIAVLRTKMVQPRGGEATGHTNKETRRWGSCMLSLSYKALPRPTIALHSRTSYLGYIGALDLTVAWMAAKYLGHEMGMKPEDFAFTWYNEAIQWHNFKSLAHLLNHPNTELRSQYRRLMTTPKSKLTETETYALENSPAMRMSRDWLMKIRRSDAAGETYGDMTYNTYRRIRRRWHTEVLGYERAKDFEGWSLYKAGPNKGEQKEFFKAYLPLPSTPVTKLDFSGLKMPFGRKYGEEYDGTTTDWEEDEDE